MRSLSALLSQSPLTLGGPRKRLLMLGTRPLARLNDGPERMSALVAHIGGENAFMEIVGVLLGNRPTAILAIEGPHGEPPVAAHLHRGELVGFLGTGPLDQLGPWAVEFQRRHGLHWEVGSGATNLRRMFLYERLLEAFRVADHPGSSLIFVQGELSWLGDEQGEAEALAFHHLLLEYARRKDEMPKVEAKVGSGDRVVVPMSEPGEFAGVVQRPLGPDSARWDFQHDPDDAARQEWLDARRVFRLCDGALTVRELADLSMLGKFRTYTAVVALAERSHVRLAQGLKVVGD